MLRRDPSTPQTPLRMTDAVMFRSDRAGDLLRCRARPAAPPVHIVKSAATSNGTTAAMIPSARSRNPRGDPFKPGALHRAAQIARRLQVWAALHPTDRNVTVLSGPSAPDGRYFRSCQRSAHRRGGSCGCDGDASFCVGKGPTIVQVHGVDRSNSPT